MSADAKILVYDIESTGLKADDAFMLVFGYKWVGDAPVGRECDQCGRRHSRVFTPSILDYNHVCSCSECGKRRIDLDDSALVREAHRVMSQAEFQITFNGKNFDLKMLNTKFMKLGLPALPAISHVDLYQTAKTNMTLTRKSLENISKFLGLKHRKTKLEWDLWRSVENGGDVRSLRYIRDHGRADILVTEELYLEHLRNYVRQHPRVNGYAACRRCGKDTLVRRGRAITIYRGQQYRFQCGSCGGWETRAA